MQENDPHKYTDIKFRVPVPHKARLVIDAQRAMCSMGAVARQAIRDYCERKNKAEKPKKRRSTIIYGSQHDS